jgi:AraC-like DNA-binding protein
MRHIPSPPLNQYIDYFYYLDGMMAFPHEKILPMPILDLKINLGGTFKVYEADSTTRFETFTDSWWVGLYSTYHNLHWPMDMRFFGIRIKPDGAYPFSQFPLSEIHNRVVPLDAIWGCLAAEIREQLLAAPTIEAGFFRLEQFLLDRLCHPPHGQNVVQHAIAQMEKNHGRVSIHALSEQIGISQNHLTTHFKRLVGVTPKEFARLIRFEYVLHSIDPVKPVNWARIAHRCGYYDQAHFNKDFMAYTGHNPTDYLPLRRLAYTENKLASESLRELPID